MSGTISVSRRPKTNEARDPIHDPVTRLYRDAARADEIGKAGTAIPGRNDGNGVFEDLGDKTREVPGRAPLPVPRLFPEFINPDRAGMAHPFRRSPPERMPCVATGPCS